MAETELLDQNTAKVNRDEVDGEIQHASDIIGEWGPFQRNVLILFSSLYFISAFQNVGVVFYMPKLDFWCKRPPGYENATLQTCQSYQDPSEPCREFEYDMSFYRSTIIDEFDLVCDRSWLVSTAKSVYQVGYAVSGIVFGVISDKYGRLTAMRGAICLELVSSLSQSLSINIEHFLISRFFLGIAAYARFLTGMLLLIEIVGPKYRAAMRVAIEVGWCVSYLAMPWIQYAVRHFRYMQLMVTGYELLFIVGVWRLPESPRWQLTHGRYKDAEKTIIAASKQHGKFTEEQVKEKLHKLKTFVDKEEVLRAEEASKTIVDLWKVPSLFRICLILYLIWFINAFTYYGFTYNAGAVGGSLFVNVFYHAIAETMCNVFLWFTINRFTRKSLVISLILSGAVATFAIIPFSFDEGGVPYRMILAMIGKFCLTGGFHIIYIQSAEVFPTTLRQIGVGSCSVNARVGSTLAPFVKELAQYTHMAVVMGVFGVLCVVEAFLLMLLPETKDKEIPDTIEEARTQNKNKA